MTEQAPVVTLKTIHADIQVLKQSAFRTEVLTEQVRSHDTDLDEVKANQSKMQAQISALYVTHSLLLTVMGGGLIFLLTRS